METTKGPPFLWFEITSSVSDWAFFVDFVCWQRKLVIELDGGQHMEQVSYGTRRSHFLVSRGFTVLRFWNDEVLNHWGE
ncbi:Protein of uncharacterised function (DUF559) [Serratia quinivorans]|nr:DUF559 domain-containing protein [Serratia quinivorans]CAI1543936.1 Protein of uncharacterised function (DUF559) [Serratia quinivorans]